MAPSNIFITAARYWHPKGGREVANARPLGWGNPNFWLLAGVEYTLAVPANRVGYAGGWTPGQLKIPQRASCNGAVNGAVRKRARFRTARLPPSH
ncbi:hypothetical protein ETX26_11695 [Pelagerythrobacter rhizovicinus]|uniref:Uncharacterized protein n=1 Tax=Pelagerythrobacter rhizovicinus TaxID=2268576 RepID=A0A4Q2KNI6_9SPHN|nr:hypothetical protein ETX26_11695 [Pelagerythrobacter rhizovicinus]